MSLESCLTDEGFRGRIAFLWKARDVLPGSGPRRPKPAARETKARADSGREGLVRVSLAARLAG